MQEPWPPTTTSVPMNLVQAADGPVGASYCDILDDLLHQDGVGQHVGPEGSVLQQQAEQLAHYRQLLRPSSVHPQALQHQPEDSRQEGQDGDTDPPELVPAKQRNTSVNGHTEERGPFHTSQDGRRKNVLLKRNKVFSDKTPQTKTSKNRVSLRAK